jgi:ABC-2 type transport system ATP-binding protein
LIVDFIGSTPETNSCWEILDKHEGRMSIRFDAQRHSVSDVITHISQNTSIQDISVSGISAEEMVASLYMEYKI